MDIIIEGVKDFYSMTTKILVMLFGNIEQMIFQKNVY